LGKHFALEARPSFGRPQSSALDQGREVLLGAAPLLGRRRVRYRLREAQRAAQLVDQAANHRMEPRDFSEGAPGRARHPGYFPQGLVGRPRDLLRVLIPSGFYLGEAHSGRNVSPRGIHATRDTFSSRRLSGPHIPPVTRTLAEVGGEKKE